jgi:transcription initiation factor TFIIF subunit beta
MTSTNSNTNQTDTPKKSLVELYGKVDASSVDNQLWLARLPKNLATLWDDLPEGTLLGHLTFTKGTPIVKPKKRKMDGSKPLAAAKPVKPIPQKLGLSVSPEILEQNQKEEYETLPLDYTLTNLTTKIPKYNPFTRHPDTGSIELHGTISRSCNLQMERSERYRNLCKSRLERVAGAGIHSRHVQSVPTGELSGKAPSAGSLNQGFGTTVASFGKQMLDAQKERMNAEIYGSTKKRKFDETSTTKSILFELFSQKAHWAIKELRGASGGRLEKEIRMELGQIAEFHRSGEFKGLWELKSEFAHKTD